MGGPTVLSRSIDSLHPDAPNIWPPTCNGAVDSVVKDPRRALGRQSATMFTVAPGWCNVGKADLVARGLSDVNGVHVVAPKVTGRVEEDTISVVAMQGIWAGEGHADARPAWAPASTLTLLK
jgi:hypothetical protein